jgi:hypothetical protein
MLCMAQEAVRGVAGLAVACAVLGVACATSAGTIDAATDMDALEEAVDGTGDGADSSGTCGRDRDCDDRIACTIDHCTDGVCSHEPCTDCCPERLQCLVGLGCGRPPTPCTTDEDCGDGVRCTLDRCADGSFCEHLPQDGLCAEGEVCLASIGCIPDPPDACTSVADCFPDRPCLGSWYCDPEFGCQFEAVLDCDDGDSCTVDACDDALGGCTTTPRDGDGDTHVDQACGGDDCDDANPDVNPDMPELPCNGIDDDCDPTTPETCCTPEPCSTPCGSTGVRDCNPDGTPGDCIPPDETCNAADDDCDTVVDEGFDCVLGATGACATTCGSAGSRPCEAGCTWGACVPPAETCSGADDDCDTTVDEGFACVSGASGPCTTICSSTGSRACQGDCTWDVCVPPAEACNGADDDCDAAIDEGFTCPAGSGGGCTTTCGSSGTRWCASDCSWGSCTPPAETCSGVDDDCDTTVDEGFDCAHGASRGCTTTCSSTGTQTCNSGCTWDACVPPAEICNGVDDDCDAVADDGFTCAAGRVVSCTSLPSGGWTGGSATCLTDCAGWNTSACTTAAWDPTGIYATSPAPSYTCAFGLVNFNITSFSFADTGTLLSVYGAPCPSPMTGASARTTRTFNVTCTYAGGCNEIYTLTGSFTTDNTWTGTFTANYVGSCYGCTLRTWSVTGTR